MCLTCTLVAIPYVPPDCVSCTTSRRQVHLIIISHTGTRACQPQRFGGDKDRTGRAHGEVVWKDVSRGAVGYVQIGRRGPVSPQFSFGLLSIFLSPTSHHNNITSTSSLDCHVAEIGLRNKENFKLHLAHTLAPLSTLPSSFSTAARDSHATETLTTPPPAYLTHSLEAHQQPPPRRPRLRSIPPPRRPCHIWPRRCTRSSTSTIT